MTKVDNNSSSDDIENTNNSINSTEKIEIVDLDLYLNIAA